MALIRSRHVVVLLLVAGAFACSPRTDRGAASTPGTGPAYSSVVPDPEVDARAANFRGSCAFAKPPGPAVDYGLKLRIVRTSLGAARVRSSAEFEVRDQRNRIGVVPSGTDLVAQGPIAAGDGSGVGYAVLVRDSEGRVCRGYVAAAAVERNP